MVFPSLADFETQLQDILNHFYNPLFRPDEQAFDLLGIQPAQGMEAVRQALKVIIEKMKPDVETPSGAYSRRFYQILTLRYLDSLSQEETAFQLGMTPRNLRRYQQQAVHTLAQRIWDSRQPGDALSAPQPEAFFSAGRSPILQELEVLQHNSPGVVAEIGESLEHVRVIARAVTPQITLEIAGVEPQLTASVHPSVLNQILLAALEQLAQVIHGGAIQLSAVLQGNWVEIGLAALQSTAEPPFSLSAPVAEVLSLVGGAQALQQDGQQVRVTLRFRAVKRVAVLLVDDNPDFFHLFRRYALRTRYVIHNIREGACLPQALAEIHPQIIILDVLLPDVDGWQLLLDLQNPAQPQPIPVIVCSALGQKELAHSLGARAYLPKPVSREQFLQALDSLLA